ncbi:MAG: hypothetical protein ACKOU6_21185, partial [Planctomycetota bacterium]
NVRLVLGSLPTKLGQPSPGNGTLEIRGGDSIEVTYLDRHTADKSQDKPVTQTIKVVGNGLSAITDGAFAESLRGVVLGKAVNLRVIDADHDTTNAADKLTVEVAIYRPKTDQELEAEAAALAGQAAGQAAPPATPPAAGTPAATPSTV